MDKELNEIINQSTGEMLVCEECGNASWILYLYHALERVGLQCADCKAYGDINFDGTDDEGEQNGEA